MNKMKKIALVVSLLFIGQVVKAQGENRVITTGVPFLLIAADARSAGMADMGVATSADAFTGGAYHLCGFSVQCVQHFLPGLLAGHRAGTACLLWGCRRHHRLFPDRRVYGGTCPAKCVGGYLPVGRLAA